MTKKTYMIPAFVAIFALAFVITIPYVMAEAGEYSHSKWIHEKIKRDEKQIEDLDAS